MFRNVKMCVLRHTCKGMRDSSSILSTHKKHKKGAFLYIAAFSFKIHILHDMKARRLAEWVLSKLVPKCKWDLFKGPMQPETGILNSVNYAETVECYLRSMYGELTCSVKAIVGKGNWPFWHFIAIHLWKQTDAPYHLCCSYQPSLCCPSLI